jgi:hypothetical protein
MRRGPTALVVAGALALSGCAAGEETPRHRTFHEYEAEFLEKHTGVGHREAEREAGEAERLAERIQRSGIKTGP